MAAGRTAGTVERTAATRQAAEEKARSMFSKWMSGELKKEEREKKKLI